MHGTLSIHTSLTHFFSRFHMNSKLILWSVTVGLGGFLFGLDTAVISGAEQDIQQLWHLDGWSAVVALLAITAGTLYQKKFCPSFDLRTGAVIQFLPTAAITALAIAVFGEFRVEWAPPFVFALGWLVLVLSLGAISLLNLLIRSGSAVNVATLFYLTPPTTALIAWAAFGETLGGIALAGMVLAVSGVWLARK